MKKKIAIFISGRGSNMQALIRACHSDGYPAKIVCVISNKPDAEGIKIAQNAGIAVHVVPYIKRQDSWETEQQYDAICREYDIDFICLAGFMRIVSSRFCDLWAGKMLNIHPSLLPSFKGLHTHERVLQAGMVLTGCSVHYVSPQMDEGILVAQAVLKIAPHETADSLSRRVLNMEHVLYPMALKNLCLGDTHSFALFEQDIL